MALMTGEQYVESIRKMNMQIYMFGEKIENPVDHPILRPSLNSVKMTYDLASMPEYEDLMTAKSHITGEKSTVSLIFIKIRKILEKSKNAAALRPEDSCLLPALCRHGCLQRRLQYIL